MDYINEQPESIFEMSIDDDAAYEIKQLGKWAKFNAIFFWSILALVLFVLIIFRNKMGEAFSNLAQNEKYEKLSMFLNNGATTILIVFMAIVFLIVGAYVALLFNFGNKLKKGVEQQNTELIETGFKNYKNYIIIGTVLATLVVLGTVVSLILKF